ncbi:MAG: dihydrofolate reductase, partial [Pedobacter sp.]
MEHASPKSPILSIVVAIAENNAIGRNNQLLWHLPADLKHFKQITTGNAIVMGRKTFESIGKALPNRKNIVITRQQIDFPEGVLTANSIEEAISLADENEMFIIGGAEIYRSILPKADRIFLTTVHET